MSGHEGETHQNEPRCQQGHQSQCSTLTPSDLGTTTEGSCCGCCIEPRSPTTTYWHYRSPCRSLPGYPSTHPPPHPFCILTPTEILKGLRNINSEWCARPMPPGAMNGGDVARLASVGKYIDCSVIYIGAVLPMSECNSPEYIRVAWASE